MLLSVGFIVAGLVLLVAGGEALVRGASSLARRFDVSALVVGLTVVSLATSAPELAVTTGSVLAGAPDLAVGNVVGSNIANLLLVLGVGAVVVPLSVERQLVRKDLPIMVGFGALLLLFSLDGGLGRIDGAILLGLYIVLTVATVFFARKAKVDHPIEAVGMRPLWQIVLLIVGGVVALVGGAQLLVTGAVRIATALGLSGLIVGLTIVAIGTSLPELAVTVVAVRQRQVDIAVGNVVGSNIANIGLVLGLPSLVGGSIPVAPAAVALDIPLMLAITVVFGFLAFTGMRIVRWEGALFLALYAAYLTYLVLAATEHDALAGFTSVVVWFAIPLVLLVVAASLTSDLHHRRRRGRHGEGHGT
ncbi:MAG: calcium/sodium antiporter [Arachnia sp.]